MHRLRMSAEVILENRISANSAAFQRMRAKSAPTTVPLAIAKDHAPTEAFTCRAESTAAIKAVIKTLKFKSVKIIA